ncbi:hypothetical protein [Paenibacillus taichungensis]|uniref:hypothetical protein n=1 Tax=Paenibacillus taichungensis TaxID=484184 RepID=UPI0028724338|nr:hypothetical protein [Paenibacillus taichungensis]MDR9747642.1 hypothetical protein [Paenibacillus taichungensis]
MKQAGRPSKYNNKETADKLKQLVYLYKDRNPHSGIVKISDMVRFSKEMNEIDAVSHPLFNRDVWVTYGKVFIDEVNEPLPSELMKDKPVDFVVPNITDIVNKHHKNPVNLLQHLLPIEVMLHESLFNQGKSISKIQELENELTKAKEALRLSKATIDRYEQYTNQMAHHSYSAEYQKEFNLPNQISVNANARNKNAMRSLDDLSSFLENGTNPAEEPSKNPNKESSLLQEWRNKRKKNETM